ncbi:zinc finger protein 34-like isoform X2 [Pleurodeles waltl]|uniref:zinc finger protein 34-like isoform X2 n=1 Tax=Pleurodeles waltl TaxID=8319 RepID=UPI003709A66B
MQDAEAPATFHDPSACFSEDEWKLLQEWQKELCRKVMKEIHQALISLGPLIATTVSSLRAREKAELCPTENQFCEGKHRMHQPSRLEVVSFCIKEEEVCSVKSPGPDRINRARSPASTVLPQYQQGLTRKVVDMVQNLEPGDERMTRKKKVEDGLKYPAKRPPPKAISGRISMMVLPSCDKEAHPRNLKWGETHPESIEEKTSQCESSLSNPGHNKSHQGTGGSHQGIGRSEQYIKSNSSLRNSLLCKELQNTEQGQKTYTCSTDKSLCAKEEFTRHLRTHSRERPYACTECKKRFFQKTHLIVHCRIHSGEKPYMCTFCYKRFNRKDYLNEHIRIHTGERPYKCTECEKSFIQKSHLVYHQRKHTESFKNSNLRD